MLLYGQLSSMVAVRTDITMKTILGDYAGTDIVDPIVCITNPNTYIIMIVCARLADYQPEGQWFNPPACSRDELWAIFFRRTVRGHGRQAVGLVSQRRSIQYGCSSIVSHCDRSTKELFCVCLFLYCFKVLVIIVVIVWWANQRAASSSYWTTRSIEELKRTHALVHKSRLKPVLWFVQREGHWVINDLKVLSYVTLCK